MPARPIADQSLPKGSAPVSSNLPLSRGDQQDSPLASQLPAWDLVPPHTLLVRRRPAPFTPASRSDGQGRTFMATPPPPARVTAAFLSPAVASPPERVPDRFCQGCGSQLEEAAAFCADCGAKVR
jgi:hypothetical protein